MQINEDSIIGAIAVKELGPRDLVILKVKQNITVGQHKQFMQVWNDLWSGRGAIPPLIILESDVDIEIIAQTPEA